MSFLVKYSEYMKDNPKGYWFKRKLYGWGWTPARWQGWLVTFGYLLIVLALVIRVEEVEAVEGSLVREFFGPLIIATAILLVTTYRTGEPPKWQWGLPEKESEADVD